MTSTAKRSSEFRRRLLARLRDFRARTNSARDYHFGRTISVIFDDYSIQLATASDFIGRTRLVDVTRIYIPSSLTSDEARRSFLISEISQYIEQHRGFMTRFVLGVGGADSALRRITLPPMSAKELKKAVYWEADKRIPFGLDNAYYGFRMSENRKSGAFDSLSATIIAVSRGVVDYGLELLAETKADVTAVYHELEAVGRLLPYIDGFEPGNEYALINIRRHNSEISFFHGQQLEFVHISSVGSEALKTTDETPPDYESFAESLIYEVQNSLDYYVGQFSTEMVNMIYIYGDMSYSDDLIERLGNRFGIQFKRFPGEHLGRLSADPEKVIDRIPICLGAVGLLLPRNRIIDLLPPPIREKKANLRYARLVTPLFIFCLAALLTYWISLRQEVAILDGRLEAAYEEIEAFRRSPEFIEYNRLKLQIAADRKILEEVRAEPTFLHLNLKEISRLTPRPVKLDLYELYTEETRRGLLLTGLARSTDPPPEVYLAEFITQLESSPFFDRVQLQKHSKAMTNGEFEINFQITMDAVI